MEYPDPIDGVREYECQTGRGMATAAEPHYFARFLLEGALSRIAAARKQMLSGAPGRQARHIQWAMSIIATLQDALNMQDGGEAAGKLDALYDYVQGQLFHANRCNDTALLDEVARLVGTISGDEQWLGLHREELNGVT